jgi:poly-gamma-glutamate synthesis protein (capsule biosynthesis protein)
MNRCKLAFVGDLMCGDSFYTLGSGIASQIDRLGRRFLSDDIVNCLSSHDIVFCNLESVLSDLGRKDHSLRSLHMRGRPGFARYLADWGFTIANVANNHILEQGRLPAVDTVCNLKQAGIKTVGAGGDNLFKTGINAVQIACHGHDIAFIGICLLNQKYAFNGGLSLHQALEMIEKLKKQNNLVAVSVHWGDELMDRPNGLQRQIAGKLIDAGAILVIGHHPHVIQAVEQRNGALVAYSLGNFIFNSFCPDTTWSMILTVTVENNKITHWQSIPIEKDQHHRPNLVNRSKKQLLQTEIDRRCGLLNLPLTDHQYRREFQIRACEAQKQLHRILLKKTMHMNPLFWPQLLNRFIQRRTDRW